MASLLPRSSLAPQCAACCRQLSRLGLSTRSSPLNQAQIRGKKKNARPSANISVKLLQDLPAYGRKGVIVPVPIGQMRNYYYPNHIAEYVTMAQAKDLKRNNVTVERDVLFGRKIDEDSSAATKAAARKAMEPTKMDLQMMTPEAAFNALSASMPPELNFYRAVISSPQASNAPESERNEAKAAEASGNTVEGKSVTNIYGSVSSADVASAIRAVLQQKDLAGRIVLEDSDIRFIRADTGEDAVDRVKQIGEYLAEIKVKGHEETIRRKVLVIAEEQG